MVSGACYRGRLGLHCWSGPTRTCEMEFLGGKGRLCLERACQGLFVEIGGLGLEGEGAGIGKARRRLLQR